MGKTHLSLQPSETAVLHAASRIYSAYVAAGEVNPESEIKLVEKSIQIAISMASQVDQQVMSDKEMM